MLNANWIFFDIGFTLVDESCAVQARIERTVARLCGTPQEISLEDFIARMHRAAQQCAYPYAIVMEQLGIAWRRALAKSTGDSLSQREAVAETLAQAL